MKLLNTGKFDGRNRITIPANYLKLIGIKSTDFVQLIVDIDKEQITIKKIDEKSQQLLEKIKGV